MVTSPRTPKPTPISTSVTRVLATVASVVIRGSSRPSTSPASTYSNWSRPARSRRSGPAEPPARAVSQRLHHRARPRPRGNPARRRLAALRSI